MRLCRSLGGLLKMVFIAFYEHDYHAGLVNFNSPHFTYSYKSIHHYCHSLLNKKARNFKQKAYKKKPQFEQPLVQKLIAKRPKLMPYKNSSSRTMQQGTLRAKSYNS